MERLKNTNLEVVRAGQASTHCQTDRYTRPASPLLRRPQTAGRPRLERGEYDRRGQRTEDDTRRGQRTEDDIRRGQRTEDDIRRGQRRVHYADSYGYQARQARNNFQDDEEEYNA